MSNQLAIARMGPTLPHLAALHGEFEDWIIPHLGWDQQRLTLTCPYLNQPLPPPESLAGVILTGSGAMVTEDHDWLNRTVPWVHQLAEFKVPILGICFGHQLLAHAFGGQVDFNPRGPEVGTVTVTPTPDAGQDALLYTQAPVLQQASHMQSVLTLPPEAVRLATTPQDDNHAFRLGDRIWGVQFHPEFSLDNMQAYINHHSPRIEAAGQDTDQLRKAVRPCPEGARLLHRFGEQVRKLEPRHG